MKLLHIDTSIQVTGSLSREMSAATVERLKQEIPGLELQYRDLALEPLRHLTGRVFAAHAQDVDTGDLSETERNDIIESKSALQDFQAADIVVLGVPLYNYSVPSTLRAWIDRIVVFGKTFRYAGPNQPIGLAVGKRVIVALARGGYYAEGSAGAEHEHAETYLRSVFSLIGINNIEFIIAEGVAVGPEFRETALRGALDAIQALAA
ncbi:NAD(P)H-dependent oxidoreductase [Bradyrhizobium tropiciagri]|uniref:FMN-dependent NADH-azoreductase n=1 Tax=Bradyrhizobium tropiciagri TaxID=312253 RepID=UPI001BAC84E5|nr:NAD(P)H-dependent oxidoreductase [Bradyrhizobium tropiciagri]MBR0894785.1 NAD(P)H-dependent oxidoreductase [Bradyrhizobium tropiciagri]